jgi:hypothetical protein
MVVLNTMVIFKVVKMFMFKGICIKLYGFLNYFIIHQNVHKNNDDILCDVYMQDMLLTGIVTLHYHVVIIYFLNTCSLLTSFAYKNKMQLYL